MPEFETIERIAKWLGKPSARVEVGIGDDAAVVMPPAGKMLVTTDMMVEGVHFDRAYCLPEEIGHKLLAINLSDIAAMGGTPRYGLVSLSLPQGTPESFLEKFYGGLRGLAERFCVDIVGGNITAGGALALDLCLIGEAQLPVTRAGARVGHKVGVTGGLGGAAAGLAVLQKWGRGRFDDVAKAQLLPEPRVREATNLAPLLSSLIDISDGLSSELHHLAKSSGVGFRIFRERLPLHVGVAEAARALAVEPWPWVLGGGEDYELLFTFAPEREKEVSAAGATVIGEVVAGGVCLVDSVGKERDLPASGWRHHW